MPDARNNYLSPTQVRRVLLSPLSGKAIAAKLGISRQAVSLIRTGRSHADLFPDLPRQKPRSRRGPSCHDCRHWDIDCCDLALPDPIEEGPGFASDCSLFAPPK